MQRDTILAGDALTTLRTLPDGCVQCCVTSPPYWGLRDYGVPGQLGLERTPEAYVARMVAVFREVRRVLRADGTLWLNMGDSYAGGTQGRNDVDGGAKTSTLSHGAAYTNKRHGSAPKSRSVPTGYLPKDLIGMPWRVALALQADSWYLRSDIIWHKPNPMPESVRDRPTRAHEYIFLLSKRARYYYDAEAIREPFADGTDDRISQPSLDTQRGGYKTEQYAADFPGRKKRDRRPADVLRAMRDNGLSGRNKRDVWTVATAPYAGAHFATFPPALIEPCVLAGAPAGGLVLDPFFGSGTVGAVCRRHSRHYLGIELNPAYVALAEQRIADEIQPVLWTA